MIIHSPNKATALRIFLRVNGVLIVMLFSLLFVGVVVQAPVLVAEHGALHWAGWNDVRCGNEAGDAALMLLLIYIVWGVFLLRASRNPPTYLSFLSFTMWANLAHGLLMAVMAAMTLHQNWNKFFYDIPFALILALGIYLLRPTPTVEQHSPATES
jgi:hypothetical protein